jgi:hypothetical protein
MTVVDSVAAVRLDEESGRLAGDHRVAHVRSVAVRAEHVDAVFTLSGKDPDLIWLHGVKLERTFTPRGLRSVTKMPGTSRASAGSSTTCHSKVWMSQRFF